MSEREADSSQGLLSASSSIKSYVMKVLLILDIDIEYAYKLEIYYFFILGAIRNIIVRKNINHTGNRRTVKGRK